MTKRIGKPKDQSHAVKLGSWQCPYHIAPHYDPKHGPEPYFEVMQLRVLGEVVRPKRLARAFRPVIQLSVLEHRDMPEKKIVEPEGVGVYWIRGEVLEATAYVPPGRLAVIGPWALAGRLGWATLTLSHPRYRSGLVKTMSLDENVDLEEWDEDHARL